MYPLLFLSLIFVLACGVSAAPLDTALQQKVDTRISEVKTWAADPTLVNAVKAQNAKLPAEYAAMTQEKWKTLTVLDPFVRSFARNEAGTFLKSKKGTWVSEAFLNDANGRKTAFLSKPTNWSHGSSAKHTQPMSGAGWQGDVEVDESTGQRQLQIAVPILAEGKPVGSLIVGLNLVEL